jgi:hypothetical protein
MVGLSGFSGIPPPTKRPAFQLTFFSIRFN